MNLQNWQPLQQCFFFAESAGTGVRRSQFRVDSTYPNHRTGRLWDAGRVSVIDRWLRVIESGKTDELEDLLAEDAVFYSPAVFTPQQGRELTAKYLRAAETLFSAANFHYVGQWIESRSAVLEFAAEVDGVTVEGIDMIHWNDDGKITSVKVMIRPLKALHTIVPAMGELLQNS